MLSDAFRLVKYILRKRSFTWPGTEPVKDKVNDDWLCSIGETRPVFPRIFPVSYPMNSPVKGSVKFRQIKLSDLNKLKRFFVFRF